MEQLRLAEKILPTANLINIRERLTAEDELSWRYFQPKTDGALADKSLDPASMEKAKSYYYALMGWEVRTGVPMSEKLEELGIT